MRIFIDWNLLAVWAQAISSTIVLFMIYLQIKQVNKQMSQSEEHEKFRCSWEFLKLYRDELGKEDLKLEQFKSNFNPLTDSVSSEAFIAYLRHFYQPRCHLFSLLDQLIQHQEVDEKILFGYLANDFNGFVEIGIMQYGPQEFKKQMGAKIKMLLALWGSQIKATALLYNV